VEKIPLFCNRCPIGCSAASDTAFNNVPNVPCRVSEAVVAVGMGGCDHRVGVMNMGRVMGTVILISCVVLSKHVVTSSGGMTYCRDATDCNVRQNERCTSLACDCGRGFFRNPYTDVCQVLGNFLQDVATGDNFLDQKNVRATVLSKVLEKAKDPCTSPELNYCSEHAYCFHNDTYTYQCVCMEGYSDLSITEYPGEVCEVVCGRESCENDGHCRVEADTVRCSCVNWFVGERCEVNGKGLFTGLIVTFGVLMLIIASLAFFFIIRQGPCMHQEHQRF